MKKSRCEMIEHNRKSIEEIIDGPYDSEADARSAAKTLKLKCSSGIWWAYLYIFILNIGEYAEVSRTLRFIVDYILH